MTSTYRRKTKTKRKLRHLTSIMPILIWQPDQVHMFRMPFKVRGIEGGIKNLQLHTPILSRKKKVWANVYQKLSNLPHEIYMKDIQFGFIPKDNFYGWNVDEHGIVWVNEQVKIPLNEIISLTFRGIAISYSEWIKTYNPYIKYNKFTIDILRNNRRVQTSLPYLMKGYKDKGMWNEIQDTKKDIWEVATSTMLGDLWYYLTNLSNELTLPNPIKSLRIGFNEVPYLNFLLTKDTMKRHKLHEYISSAPKYLSQEKMDKKINKIINSKLEIARNEDDLTANFDRAYEQYVNEEQPTRSDGTRQEENDPF